MKFRRVYGKIYMLLKALSHRDNGAKHKETQKMKNYVSMTKEQLYEELNDLEEMGYNKAPEISEFGKRDNHDILQRQQDRYREYIAIKRELWLRHKKET